MNRPYGDRSRDSNSEDVRGGVRRALVHFGTRLSPERLHDLSCVLGALALGEWVGRQPRTRILARRARSATFLDAQRLLTGARPLYLEFGVWKGESLRWWVEHLRAPQARFVGFDSFEGLPEQWLPEYPEGTFNTRGEPPEIDDPRVSFEVGPFDKTLTSFVPPEHDQMLVNIDCTLYSSTAIVLEYLEPYIRPGDLVLFDELPEYDHELRALFEHDARIDLDLVPVSHSRAYCWLFQYVDSG